MFRFFFSNNPFSQATKGLAKGSFFTGLFLIAFGMLVFVLRDIFAFLAAVIFFMAGASAIVWSIKLFIAARQMHRHDNTDNDVYRQNVTIHREFRD